MNTKAEVSDQELVSRYVESGDSAAFGVIYERYVDQVYRFSYSRLGNSEWAEDIASETFTTLVTILPNFRGEASVKTFIFAVALNKMRALWQKQKRMPTIQLEDYMQEQITEGIETDEDSEKLIWLRKNLQTVIGQLELKEQQVLTERFMNNSNVQSTAEVLGLTPANVRVIQHRALKKAAVLATELIKQATNEQTK
jgi:RNA polymerase sigma-70 factor, ECF subfamily